jgi:hypothetical protein
LAGHRALGTRREAWAEDEEAKQNDECDAKQDRQHAPAPVLNADVIA